MRQERYQCDRCGATQDWDVPKASAWLSFEPNSGVHIYTEYFGTLDLCPDCARGFEQWFVEGAPDGLFTGQERYDPDESTHHWPETGGDSE